MANKIEFEKPIFSPGVVEALTGVSTDAQRDLRHKGFLSNYGTASEGGRWKYSFRDVVAFSAAAWLMKTNWHRHSSCAVAWTEAPTIFAFLSGADVPALPHRFVAILHDFQDKGDVGLGSDVARRYARLAEMDDDLSFGRAEVIDLKFVAARLAGELKDLVSDYELA